MKRTILAFALLLFTLLASSQIMKERRVYYLDCSYSMKQKGLWDIVRDNLKKAINNVSDETTELIVIPFAFNCDTSPVLCPIVSEATPAGKVMIKSEIDALPMNRSTMTYHYVPIEDFYSNRVADDRITYMFLMTDGQDDDPRKRTLNVLLPQWGERYGDKNVFGFYVMLCNEAYNSKISQVIEGEEHLWKVQTADVNINLIRLRENIVHNVRDGLELEIKVEQGVLSHDCPIEILETLCDGAKYKIENIVVDADKIVAHIQTEDSLSNLPDETMLLLCLKPIIPSQANGFSCLVNDRISIKCKNKKERTLKIRFE